MAETLTHVEAPQAWLIQVAIFYALTNSPPHMVQARITGGLTLAKASANTQQKPSNSYTTYIYKLVDMTAAELTLQQDTAHMAECYDAASSHIHPLLR